MTRNVTCPHCKQEIMPEHIKEYEKETRVEERFQETHERDLTNINKMEKRLIIGSLCSTVIGILAMFYLVVVYQELSGFLGFLFDYILPTMMYGGLFGVMSIGFYLGIWKRKKLFKAFREV